MKYVKERDRLTVSIFTEERENRGGGAVQTQGRRR